MIPRTKRRGLVLLTWLLLLVLPQASFCLSQSIPPYTFVILGGTGRIGTAVASHLLQCRPESRIVLVGRDQQKGNQAIAEIVAESLLPEAADITWQFIENVWDETALRRVVNGADCVIHTAGPYLDKSPIPLRVAIAAENCKAYVDVSDPLDYLDTSLQYSQEAKSSGTSALVAAGAFPGMSNVLAVEAASHLKEPVQDVRFHYFTAGLGGSGDVNLYITNLGFGEPMAQYDKGNLRLWQALSGVLLGKVSFFLDKDNGFGNDLAKQRIGVRTVFSWPFPEAATVPRELGARGDSSAAMGTAPDAWNTMLGILVTVIPRSWWRSRQFSQFLADFSKPLVKATDTLLRLVAPDKIGETHAMRVDVTGIHGSAFSIVQAHESFRRCVGQSCAEFALDLLEHASPGVYLPEQRYRQEEDRKRIVSRLTTTPGTLTYTGPVAVTFAPPPSDLEAALLRAAEAEK